MNKKEFIKLLEEKLSILEETELKDIVNEYKDIIEEKVKHGKTEEEAVKDFGNIEDLVSEILKAYKINPKYGGKNTTKEFINDFESLIQKGANALANFTKNIIDDFKESEHPLTIEFIFELLLKSIVLLVILAFMRLPFEFINFLGKSILEMAFHPLDNLLIFIWSIILWCLYITVCVLIAVLMFKKTLNVREIEKSIRKNSDKKKTKKSDVSSAVKEEIKNESKKEEIKIHKVREDKVFANNIGAILTGIFKIFIVIFCLVPLWFINFGIYMLIILAVYYFFIGINTIGILILSIGLAIAFTYLSRIFHNVAFNRKRVYFMPFIASLALIVTGGLLTAEMVFRIDYIDTPPAVKFSEKTEVFNLEISEQTDISYVFYNDISKIIEDDLSDGSVRVEVTYYDRLVDKAYAEVHHYEVDRKNSLDIYYYNSYNNGAFFSIYNIVIDNLKKNKIYNYEELYGLRVKIYANTKTMELIK